MAKALVVALLLALGGCGPELTGPDSLGTSEDGRTSPDLEDHRVSGDGQFRAAYFGGWFSMTASARASGGVTEGEIRLVGPEDSAAFDAPLTAAVTCLSVVENQAWVGALVTDGFLLGWGMVFGVRDNGGGDGPDQRSRIELSSTGYADCLSFHPPITQPFARGDFKVW